MKYQEGLEKTKEHLKRCTRSELQEIIDNTGLSEQKAKIILLKFLEEKDRLFISDKVACAECKVYTKTTQALNKIKRYLRLAGIID